MIPTRKEDIDPHCREDIERVTHFLLDFFNFRDLALYLWDINLKTKIPVSDPTDGVLISNFIANLG